MTQTYKDFINEIKEVIYNQPIPPHYNPDEWKEKNFNCYAYVLRICMNFDSDTIKKGIIPRPGFVTRGKENDYKRTKECTLQYFKEDCEALGLQLFPTTLKELIGENEYKIAVYVKEGRDFHFMRQDCNGKWSEKNGWSGEIRILNEKNVTKKRQQYKLIGMFRVSKK